MSEEPQKTWGMTLFENTALYRVKGELGLWEAHAPGRKLNYSVLKEYLNPENKKLMFYKDLELINNLVFTKQDQSRIGIAEVFDNLYLHNQTNSITLDESTLLMPIMVPDFDPDAFKLYHAKKVVGWYLEVVGKHNALQEEMEK